MRRIVTKVEITLLGGTNVRFVVTNMSGLAGGIYQPLMTPANHLSIRAQWSENRGYFITCYLSVQIQLSLNPQGFLIQFSRLDWFQPTIVNCCATGLIRSELCCSPARTVNHGNHVDLAWK